MMLQRTILKDVNCFHCVERLCNVGFHQSSICLKKKQKFFNPYVKQYCPRIDTGYVEDYLTKLQKQSILNIEDSEPDFEKQLLHEARRRQRLYKKRKYLDRMGVKSKSKAKLLFTPDQIELMKFLHRDKPDVHTISSLAVSFDVHPEEIIAALKSKLKTNPNTDSSEADRFYKPPSSSNNSLAPVSYERLLNPFENEEENIQTIKKEEEITQNPWLRNFEVKTKPSEMYVEVDEMFEDENEMEESLSDEHHELFDFEEETDELDEDLDGDQEDVEDNVDDVNSDVSDDANNDVTNKEDKDEDEINVNTADNVNFYDDDGRFLYKIT